MATWTAEVFVNSSVGTITTEVEAASFSGARDQIYAKHGQVQSIRNLREVRRSDQSRSSASSGGPNGLLAVFGAVAILIAIASGSFNQSPQPDANRQSPGPDGSGVPQSPAEQAPAPEPATSQALWGAFAISPSTSGSSYATGYESEEEAQRAAISSCGNNDCSVLGPFGPGFATLAESDKNWFYTYGHSSETEAAADAMRQCEEKDPGQNCRITKTVNF